MGTTLVLVRHAQSIWPHPGGPDDLHRGLDPVGHRQAAALTVDLVALRPTMIYSSPYLRAVQTVQPAATAMGQAIETRHALREWDSGLPPGPDWESACAASWHSPHLRRPDGESLHELTVRALASLAKLADEHPDACVVVGTHGMFLGRALVGLGCRFVDWTFCRELPMPVVFHVDVNGTAVSVRGPGI